MIGLTVQKYQYLYISLVKVYMVYSSINSIIKEMFYVYVIRKLNYIHMLFVFYVNCLQEKWKLAMSTLSGPTT